MNFIENWSHMYTFHAVNFGLFDRQYNPMCTSSYNYGKNSKVKKYMIQYDNTQ